MNAEAGMAGSGTPKRPPVVVDCGLALRGRHVVAVKPKKSQPKSKPRTKENDHAEGR